MDAGKSIDLQDFPRQSSKLLKAREDWGCFRIINHEKIHPLSLMQEMKAVVRSLLDLPQEIKL
jgi:2-oxoglutarate-dependent dioxygenase